MDFFDKCPLCGTSGKTWDKDPEVRQCPHCDSLFSAFGLVMESQREVEEFWS
ncbi:MAG: hypothetical protein HY520_04165 [Candidatus Aenigmarchaeota archaeon]|nr:hypothetical protein [Candidatus Aenigmarchaeota archaeon]